MRLNEALKDKQLDVRIRDRLVAEGKLSQKDLEGYLNSLSDDSANVELVDPEDDSRKENN